MGEVQVNTKPFLLVPTRHWAVAQGGTEREASGEDQTLQDAVLGFWARTQRGCAHLCTHRTLSEVPRTIGGTQRVPRGEQCKVSAT